jgi:tellurite resistance protein TehA-like permease
MNIKLKAALISLGVIGSGLITGLFMSQLPNWVVAVLVIVFALALIYNLALDRLKFQETIINSEIGKKYEK